MRRPFFRVPAITLSTLPILYRHSGERRNPVERSLWVLTEACARESGCQDDGLWV